MLQSTYFVPRNHLPRRGSSANWDPTEGSWNFLQINKLRLFFTLRIKIKLCTGLTTLLQILLHATPALKGRKRKFKKKKELSVNKCEHTGRTDQYHLHKLIQQINFTSHTPTARRPKILPKALKFLFIFFCILSDSLQGTHVRAEESRWNLWCCIITGQQRGYYSAIRFTSARVPTILAVQFWHSFGYAVQNSVMSAGRSRSCNA